MALTPGTRFGPYEVTAQIGAGGMGEVYRARDTRLDRTVAIKVLPVHVASDPDPKQRFEREAKALAALSHPHICPVFDVGQQDGIDFLVMEYLEGQTLAARLEKGALPLDQALHYAIQMADGLDKAHRKGIVHRDLKPGNVMLTKSGVKLLDFGLAKLQPAATVAGSIAAATMTSPLTAQGTILGTLQYMAPEQLEGADADARTDIFAFGSVLFEMVTGRRAFEGKSQASLSGAILKDVPKPVSAWLPIAPPALDRFVATCLAKDPDDRWQTARDLWRELKWITDGSAQASSDTATASTPKGWRRGVPLAAAGLIGAAIALSAMWTLRPAVRPPTSSVVRLAVPLPPGPNLLGLPGVALSSDGTQLAYAGGGPIILRNLDSLESHPIPGTDAATGLFFSPDGKWIGFRSQGKLKKVPVSGGAPVIICDATNFLGATWGPDNSVYFAPSLSDGIWKVSAAGGTPQRITVPDRTRDEVFHAFPQLLPSGNALLFTAVTGLGWDEADVHLQILTTGERHVLIQGGVDGRYLSSGHLVYLRLGSQTLMAAPFDVGRFEMTGSPVALAEHVSDIGNVTSSAFAASDSGVLAYVPGDQRRYERRMVWVDRKGSAEPLAAPVRAYFYLAIAPDGLSAAVNILGGAITTWIYDFSRTTLTPLNTAGNSELPAWTPDAKRIAYRGTRRGLWSMLWKAADGSGDEEPLTPPGEALRNARSWTPDGKRLAFQEINASGSDVWILPLDGDRKPQLFLKTPFWEWEPRFSPDGRWVAYVADDSGRWEIYIRPFPGPGANLQISTDGGTLPVWSRDGRELFYLNGPKTMAVDITTRPVLRAGSPRLLFEKQVITDFGGTTAFDVSPDGRRFLMIQPIQPEQVATQVNVVINWFEELKRLVPRN